MKAQRVQVSGSWAKHLKPFGKRQVAKKTRRALKRDIRRGEQ